MVRIAHVALWASDLERMLDFWEKYFSARRGPLYQSARRPGFTSCFLTLGDGLRIEVMTGPWISSTDALQLEQPGWAHLAVAVGSQQAVRVLADELALDGRLQSPPRWTGDGFYEAVARGPDGILVEITV